MPSHNVPYRFISTQIYTCTYSTSAIPYIRWDICRYTNLQVQAFYCEKKSWELLNPLVKCIIYVYSFVNTFQIFFTLVSHRTSLIVSYTPLRMAEKAHDQILVFKVKACFARFSSCPFLGKHTRHINKHLVIHKTF